MAAHTGPTSASPARSAGCTTASGVELVPVQIFITESDATSGLGTVGARSISSVDGSPDDSFREDIVDSSLLVNEGGVQFPGGSTFFHILLIRVVLSLVTLVTVGVAVTAEDDEAKQVREETSAAYNEDEFGVVDLGWFDESCEGLEDNGDAERDEEDGVEEGTENLSAHPL